MFTEIADSVIVMNGAVRLDFIERAEAVFHNHNRSTGVSRCQFVQRPTQAVRVDLPAPIARLEIRIFRAAEHTVADCVGILIRRNATGHVIAERVEINLAFAQNFFIVLVVHERRINFHILIKFFGEVGISPANLHVAAKVVAQMIRALSCQHIFRIRRQGITRHVAQHTTDFEFGIDFVPRDNRLSRRDKLIMQSLNALLRHVFKLAEFAGRSPI